MLEMSQHEIGRAGRYQSDRQEQSENWHQARNPTLTGDRNSQWFVAPQHLPDEDTLLDRLTRVHSAGIVPESHADGLACSQEALGRALSSVLCQTTGWRSWVPR